MAAQQYMMKIRMDDDRPELVVYCCFAESQDLAEQQLRRALECRGMRIAAVVHCCIIPDNADARWWDEYGRIDWYASAQG